MAKTLRSIGLVACVVAMGVGLGGCRWFRGGWGGSGGSSYSSPSYTESSLEITNGYQEGEMGEVAGFAATTFVEEGYSYDGYAHVRLESQGAGWWVMSLINVSGATLDELEPGVTYVTATSGTLEDGQPDVSITGCSGPVQGNYTYDTQATRVETEVQDLGDGYRHVTIHAYFPDYETGGEVLTTAEFDYRTVG